MSCVVLQRAAPALRPMPRLSTRGPRWRLALPDSVRQVHTAYFGVQRHSPADPSMRAAARATAVIRDMLERSGVAAIETFDVVAGHDMPGARVQVAYWNDPETAHRCLAALDLTALHVSLGEWRDSVGLWCEQFTTAVSRLETDYSGPDALRRSARFPGLAALPQALAVPAEPRERSGTLHEWRHTVSDDPFDEPLDPTLPELVPFGYGEIVSGFNLHELVHVRSGFDWSDCGPVEAALRERGLQMLIDLGLDHLWSHPIETGAYGLRQLLRVDAADQPLADIGVSGFMRNDADLARWNDEHAQHVADFQRLLDQEGLPVFERRLRSYQEVSVLEPGEARFDYVNCGPRTGVIRFVDLGRHRLRVRHDLA